MKKKVSNQEILNKIAQKFNEKGFNKNTINEKDKEELKPVLREIYKEYQSFGGMEKSQKENWRKACFEIMQEFKKENKEETKTIQKDDNYKSTEKEENKKDLLKREDYDDDLIQLEFPKVYIDKIHGPKIEKLAEQLEKQRKEEKAIREYYDKLITEEIKNTEKQEKSQQFNVDERKKLESKIQKLKSEMKQKIKDNPQMTNNEFLMLLHLMRLRKETVYESNPYIVDFSVTLESVYQSEKDEDDGDDNNYLFSRFENDLNKYVD